MRMRRCQKTKVILSQLDLKIRKLQRINGKESIQEKVFRVYKP